MLGPHDAVPPVVPRPLADAPIQVLAPAPQMPAPRTSAYYRELGRQLRLVRETLGLSSVQWQRIFDVSKQATSQWERGEAHGPSLLGARSRRTLARLVQRPAVRRQLAGIWEDVRPLMEHLGIAWPPLRERPRRRRAPAPAPAPAAVTARVSASAPAPVAPVRPQPPPVVRWGRDDVPPCLDSLREWQLYYRASRRAQRSPWPCALCTPEYQAEMAAAGRCANPHLLLPAPPLPQRRP